MQFAGPETIPATRERVWQFLIQPEMVSQCVPDVEGLEVVDGEHFKATVKAGIGPVRGKFAFQIAWQELTEPTRAHMKAQGKSGANAVTVDSTMDLNATGDNGTELAWKADVVVHGMLASLGARLLDGFARKQTEQFFGCIREKLSG
jgi:carbon monoxide dehydrogenase subunit G